MRDIIKEKIKNDDNRHKIMLVMGRIGTGKFSTLKDFVEETGESREGMMASIAMDRQCAEDPAAFWKKHPYPLLIGEIQRMPHVLASISDNAERMTPGFFLLTCSFRTKEIDQFLLDHRRDIRLIQVRSESRKERRGELLTAFDIRHYLSLGSSLCSAAETWSEDLCWFKAFEEEIVKNQLTPLRQKKWADFLSELCACIGSPLNISFLAKRCKISMPMVLELWDFAKRAFLCFELPVLNGVADRRMVAQRKIYFYDTAVLFAKGSKVHPGLVFENECIAEIEKGFASENRTEVLSYFRNKDMHSSAEVDLLIPGDDGLIPVEITVNYENEKHRARRLFSHWRGEKLSRYRIVIDKGNQFRKIGENTLLIPVAML